MVNKMSICKRCNREMAEVSDEDLRKDYASQADYYGMDSLTENEQLLVEGSICEDCYEKID